MMPGAPHIALRIQSSAANPVESADSASNEEGRRVRLRLAALGIATGVVIGCGILAYAPEVREVVFRMTSESGATVPYDRALSELEAENRQVEKRVSRLKTKLQSALPRSAYLVVSTSDNRFELYGRGGLEREGVCSTGSYVLLRGGNDQEWMFETPRGVFRILEKRINPVWSKPDWAFVEEGLPVPPPGARERYERGVLGKYALAIGNGYLIHGTLYQRMLGQPVTHGCIRLGDEDLEAVHRALSLGARVFIY
ncbi:MAG TPA: L,D-transpeptidase [Rhodothermales bacterium]|nr:L,D-transpeptidase [Rhodothermales bacterium]